MSVKDRNKFRQNLLSISEGLTDDDVTHMKSLCSDVISRKEADKISSGFELFELLESKGRLSVDYVCYLADLLKCVGQICLLKYINLGDMTLGTGRCQINTFRLYLTKLGMEIDDIEFEALKKACNCNKEEITHFYQLMTFLENQKKITARDMSFLEDVFKKAKLQGDIPSILQSFKRQLAYEADQYRITSDPKGICVIINNENFTSGHTNRRGTSVDARRLERLFQTFSYEVELHKDRNAKEITDILKAISVRDHWRYDCFICCVLSHGSMGRVFGVDGMDVAISSLLELFFDSKCPSLAEKPKLFFFQACQGDASQQGLEMDIPAMDVKSDVLIDDKQPSAVDLEANMLLGYATPPGYKSYRSEDEGSWYIQALVDRLKGSAERENILDILTQVNNDVSKKHGYARDGSGYVTQIPCPVFTLKKKLFLDFDTKLNHHLQY
ncbi:caspase-3-like [Haliotis rufescens]|uniref:caspase-3-like n=1 Tax=Haliotis rufescens TaxID=6454 RepID=UPI00201F29B8|nr:caspase-3-like [Haliotis rufescens]XP_046327021.2 caspase-3-like [Haliotis rufescens]XP_046327022.2 caspase-3-like [Haliotis rufescens]